MKQTQASGQILRTFWTRIPVLLRAIVTGFLVSTIGIACWTADIRIFELSALSILGMLIPLGLYLKFFTGRSWPMRSSATRSFLFRNVSLSSFVWKWGLVAGLLFVLVVQSAFVITFRLISLPETFSSQYKIIETLPIGVAWLAIVMSSLVAGVCEEVGFRGYMQVSLEKRYGPGVAILITSVIFTLIHLDRSWAGSILPVIFVASIMLGILAYASQSLIPGIIGHTVLDIFDYSLWWTKLLGRFEWKTIFVTGIDGHFVLWCLIFLGSLGGFFAATRKLKNSWRENSSQCFFKGRN
jgi:membrane protease YdiL (CAAX protease family)